MNPKKTKEKERRRARKLAEETWEAANDHNLDMAEKLIRRAVSTQPENPVLWNDQGMLLAMRSKEVEAEEAFRTAISLAPTYVEPFAHLAASELSRLSTGRRSPDRESGAVRPAVCSIRPAPGGIPCTGREPKRACGPDDSR